MRTNRKCNNSHGLKHQLQWYFAFRQNPLFLKDQNMKKYQHYIDTLGGEKYCGSVFSTEVAGGSQAE